LREAIERILNSEMRLATGCTEPAAIALCAAVARRALGVPAESVRVSASGNMVKNAMAAGIPHTDWTGIRAAAAIGAAGADADAGLEVLDRADAAIHEAAGALLAADKVALALAETDEKLYIDVALSGGGHTARAVIAGDHERVVRTERDGAVLFSLGAQEACGVTPEYIQETLSVRGIWDYVRTMPPEETPEIILRSIEINSAISHEGLTHDYGLCIGKTLQGHTEPDGAGTDLATCAMFLTAGGADARMAGAPMPVVSNSGSGNQGITATMPVVAAARFLAKPRGELLRAVTLSNLILIYIKSKFGRLSALCGATVAATGAACGITYLMGGSLREISFAIFNMMGNVTGMLCDGAKADCALKISTCVGAAVQASNMAMHGLRVARTDGIVDEDVEQTIENFARLGSQGSAQLDRIILEIMLGKGRESQAD